MSETVAETEKGQSCFGRRERDGRTDERAENEGGGDEDVSSLVEDEVVGPEVRLCDFAADESLEREGREHVQAELRSPSSAASQYRL